jgi:tyrosine-protein kinase
MVLATAAVQVALAFGALQLVTPLYESTSSLQLQPRGTEQDSALIFFGTLDSIVPIYTNAATSPSTLELAANNLGTDLPETSVEAVEGIPLIRLKARDADPETARVAVQALTDALLEREDQFGLPFLKLQQLDRPARATEPVYPREKLTLAVACVLGLSLGAAAAFVRDSLATAVETPEGLSRLVGAPCFGEIPREPAVGRIKQPDDFATNPRLRSVAEALRDLRTNLLFAGGDIGSLLITSPEGGHGKTTISLGLAVTLARGEARTVLVDGDLRKGRISELLGIPRSPGLTEALTGTPAGSVVRASSLETLDVITGGTFIGDPGELLLAEFPTVLERLEDMYDLVVIDAPPIGPVNDSRIMARFAKSTLLVASADQATRRTIRAAVEQLSLIGIKPTAVVLNNARLPGGRDYYGYLEPPVSSRQRGRRATGRWRVRRAG